MTKDDIIRMAQEAGAKFDPHWGIAYNCGTATFERFAALVAAAEREECVKTCEALDTTRYPRSINGEVFSTAIAVCTSAIRVRDKA